MDGRSKMKRAILVTGADGFIGSHLCEKLVADGFRVKALVKYNSWNSWGWLDSVSTAILKELEVVSGDIRDADYIRNITAGCDVVMHLAALIAIPYSYISPVSYLETNVAGTVNVLNAARDQGVSRVIHTSTSEVYGSARYVPICEDHPLQAQSPYSASKIAADQFALAYHRSYGLPVSIIRPFNTYGPRQSARAIIPTIITQIMAGESESLSLGALDPTRDLSYVDDTVQGFVAAIDRSDIDGETINLGANFEIDIGSLAQTICSLMGVQRTVVPSDERKRPEKSEVTRLWSDNSKALDLLEWSPKYSGISGLESGLRKTIEWFGNPENLKFYKSQLYNL